MSDASVFSPRVLLGWVAAVAAAFAFSIYFMSSGSGTGEYKGPEVTGPNALSRSAVGYAGLAGMLERLGLPVVTRNAGRSETLRPGSVVIIAEPQPSADAEANGFAIGRATGVLYVLPKWRGLPSLSHDGWIDDAILLPPANADWTLAQAGDDGHVVRVPPPAAWTTNTLGAAPSPGPVLQLIADSDLTPIIAAEQGILIGETRRDGRLIRVVADPDILANQGLLKGENAALALTLVEELRGGGKIVFDTTVRGAPAGTGLDLDLLRLLVRPPFIWVTVLALAAVAMLLWAAMPRFGKPEDTPELFAAGKRPLLRNVANLLDFASHQEVVVGGYVQSTIRTVARRLHAPRDLAGGALVDWLDRVGRARGVTIDLPRVVATMDRAATAASDRAALIRATGDIHRWKREILNGL